MSDYFERMERQLVRRVEAGLPHRSLQPVRITTVLSVAAALVVVGVIAVFLSIGSRSPRRAVSGGGIELVYRAEPTPQVPHVTTAAIHRVIEVMRARVDQLGIPAASISSYGHDEISVVLPGGSNTRRAERLVGTTARLEFYDWEANTLIPPTGATVASQLPRQNPTALTASQGSGSSAPGSPGAGSTALYPAVQLAAKQPALSEAQCRVNNCSRVGPEYFAFGKPGGIACGLAALFYHRTTPAGQPCYLAGPYDSTSDLASTLPRGVRPRDPGVKTLRVPQGTAVLQAVPSNFSHAPSWSDPTAQFYVLKDRVALFSNEISDPKQSTDPSGAPDVVFGFTGRGATAFQQVTAQIAHRGDLLSSLGQTLNQHFAVALDTQLITVPSIDFKTFPDGVQGHSGFEITGGFTINTAQHVAAQLRLGALPVRLALVSAQRPG